MVKRSDLGVEGERESDPSPSGRGWSSSEELWGFPWDRARLGSVKGGWEGRRRAAFAVRNGYDLIRVYIQEGIGEET